MRAFSLDFIGSRSSPKLSIVTLMIGCLLAGVVVWDDSTRGDALIQTQDRLKHAKKAYERSEAHLAGPKGKKASPFGQSDDVALRLAAPWGELLDALEHAQTDSIALLNLEPDTSRGRLRIGGEAKDSTALVAYMKSLDGNGGISSLHLLMQQIKPTDPQQPIEFLLEARWNSGRRAEQREGGAT